MRSSMRVSGGSLVLLLLAVTTNARAEEYVVGSVDHPNLASVPWDSLVAGDIVTIPFRAAPYRETFAVSTSGAVGSPITVRGTLGPNGERPIIDGENATQGADTHVRSLIGVRNGASYVVIEGLEVRHAHVDYAHAGLFPSNNASGIYVEDASHVTVRNCDIHGNGNGLFSAPGTSDLRVERNYIWGNGNDGSTQEHNSYTESDGILFEGNRYGPLCAGCRGNNLKDRSAGTIIRYNFIDGGNRTLDLVEAENNDPDLTARVASTPVYVYGNVLIKRDDTTQSQVVHFGGDNGDTPTYRKTLYFYNNTVYSTRAMRTTFFHFDAEGPVVDVRNSIFVVTSTQVLLLDSSTSTDSSITLTHVYLPPSWDVSVATELDTTVTSTNVTTGTEPGFVNVGALDFHLIASAAARNQGTALAGGAPTVLREYVTDLTTKPRDADGPLDLGAFEFCETGCSPAEEPPVTPIGDGGVTPSPNGGDGCGCHVHAATSTSSAELLACIVLALVWRRARSR